jgi:hypothetical protein
VSLSWTQPTCEKCWILRKSEWDDDVLVSIDRPVTVKDDSIQQCSYCGAPTIVGIYTRADPTTVAFPREKEPDD